MQRRLPLRVTNSRQTMSASAAAFFESSRRGRGRPAGLILDVGAGWHTRRGAGGGSPASAESTRAMAWAIRCLDRTGKAPPGRMRRRQRPSALTWCGSPAARHRRGRAPRRGGERQLARERPIAPPATVMAPLCRDSKRLAADRTTGIGPGEGAGTSKVAACPRRRAARGGARPARCQRPAAPASRAPRSRSGSGFPAPTRGSIPPRRPDRLVSIEGLKATALSVLA
jgi:hypothetical protein